MFALLYFCIFTVLSVTIFACMLACSNSLQAQRDADFSAFIPHFICASGESKMCFALRETFSVTGKWQGMLIAAKNIFCITQPLPCRERRLPSEVGCRGENHLGDGFRGRDRTLIAKIMTHIAFVSRKNRIFDRLTRTLL